MLICILSTNNTWAQPVEAEVREIASQRIEAQIKTIYDHNEMNAVMRAAALGDVATMKTLVAAGADCSITGHNGMTALDAAKLYNSQIATPLDPEILTLLDPS